MGNDTTKAKELERLRTATASALECAQQLKTTKTGQPINQSVTTRALTRKELEKMKRNTNISSDVRIILNAPFSAVDRITDSLYLTGVAGLIEENFKILKITCIINATYEMPMLRLPKIETWRVPVDDDADDEILIYFDDVADKIHQVAQSGGRTIVHCMAGASRSSSLVLAYLIKYHDYTLKNAFCYLKSMRPCARPNIGFFRQLILYEEFFRKETSVAIIPISRNDKTIYIPDFYSTLFPDLYKAEINKQLNRSHVSQIKLQESNKNYINRTRGYMDIHRDIANQLKQLPSSIASPNVNGGGGGGGGGSSAAGGTGGNSSRK